MKVVDRLPKVGDVLLDSSCFLYLVVGFSNLKTCLTIKLGGCLYDEKNGEILNSDNTMQYISNTIDAIIANKVDFNYLTFVSYGITYTKFTEKVIDGHIASKGNSSDFMYGVLDNYTYNNSDIKIWYMKHKLVNSKIPELIDIDATISNELELRNRKKKEEFEKKKKGVYLNVKDLKECCLYKQVAVKHNTDIFLLYLGEFYNEKVFLRFTSYSLDELSTNDKYIINGYGTIKYYKAVPKLYAEPIYANLTKKDLGPKVIKSLEYTSKTILDRFGITRSDIDVIRFGRYR